MSELPAVSKEEVLEAIRQGVYDALTEFKSVDTPMIDIVKEAIEDGVANAFRMTDWSRDRNQEIIQDVVSKAISEGTKEAMKKRK
jgi:hypothetical protein